MRRIIIRPAARVDLFDIWFWSDEQWGEAKADAYLDEFEGAKLTLVDHPSIGVACDNLHPGLRRYPFGQHRIYYLDEGNVIEIVRVLHNRMNAEDSLGDL